MEGNVADARQQSMIIALYGFWFICLICLICFTYTRVPSSQIWALPDTDWEQLLRMISGRSRGSQAVLHRFGGCFGRWHRCMGTARAGSCWPGPQMGITRLHINFLLNISLYLKSQCHCALACSLLPEWKQLMNIDFRKLILRSWRGRRAQSKQVSLQQ